MTDMLLSDLEDLEKTRAFAISAHGDQKYGDKPYSYHISRVENTLVRFGFTSLVFRKGGLCHDVLEDTNVTRAELEAVIGKEASDLSFAVTNEPGKNRKERNLLTYPKIKAYPNGDAIVLKLADRIVNAEESQDNPGLLSMYKSEYPGFRVALYTDDPRTQEMWKYLDTLLG